MLIHSESCTSKCMAKTLQQREERQLPTKLQLLPRQRPLLKLMLKLKLLQMKRMQQLSAVEMRLGLGLNPNPDPNPNPNPNPNLNPTWRQMWWLSKVLQIHSD